MGLARGAGQCTRSLDRLKTKNPACAAVKRKAEGDWGGNNHPRAGPNGSLRLETSASRFPPFHCLD